jgi:hypothetical protein
MRLLRHGCLIISDSDIDIDYPIVTFQIQADNTKRITYGETGTPVVTY